MWRIAGFISPSVKKNWSEKAKGKRRPPGRVGYRVSARQILRPCRYPHYYWLGVRQCVARPAGIRQHFQPQFSPEWAREQIAKRIIHGATIWIISATMRLTISLNELHHANSYAVGYPVVDVNSGMEWSVMDIADLEHCLRIGTPLPEIASFLMRDEEEVRQKIEELDAAA
jgi:hypothetical protein